MIYLLVLTLSIILNLFFKTIFLRKKIVDEINIRSSHNTIATRSGGTVLFVVLLFYSSYLYFIGEQPFDFSIFIPLGILYITGLYDDIYKVDFGLKFIFQIIAAKYMIDTGYVIDIFSFFELEYAFSRQISQIITIIVFVAVFNAYNFIDGIDSNIHLETIKNILLIIIFFQPNQTYLNLMFFSLIIIFVTLFFNLSKKQKVFMGDSGSLILPLLIIIFTYESTYSGDRNILKYLFVIFLYPLIDLSRVVLIRLKNKRSPFLPDTNHIHHLLNKKLNSHFKVAIIIMSIVLTLQLFLILIIF